MLVMTGCLSVMAQSTVFNNISNRPYFGIRIGGDVTCPGKLSTDYVGIDMFKNGGGVEFGGIYNIPIVANFYIEPGVNFLYNTYSIKKEFVEAFQEDIVRGMSIKKFDVSIPVMAGYHFDFTNDVQLAVFTGPELDIALSGKIHAYGHNIDVSESLYDDDEGGMKRVNVLWGIGAGISYKHLFFGIKGGIGMVNMINYSSAKFHENRVTFSLGYNF